MGKLAFSNPWKKWMKECVGTSTAAVMVNSSPADEFPLAQGLSEGDLVSPFLFLLAADGFHVMM